MNDKNKKEKGLVPELRFPEFKDKDEWEKKKLGEVFNFFKGQGLSKDVLDNAGKNECILYGELYTTYSVIIENIKSRTDIDYGVRSKKDDILVPASTTTSAIDLARASSLQKDNVLLGGDINIFRAKHKNILSKFIALMLTYIKNKEMSKYAQGSTIIHLYTKAIKEMMLEIPNIEEQQKIADCLSSIDELIKAREEKLELLKKHKKGLMQQLFPNKTVEGRVPPPY